MSTLLQDLRYGLRMLAKTPGFTAVVAVILALGIGANTAIFSLIDAVLLQSLPVRAPEKLVVLQWSAHTWPKDRAYISYGDCMPSRKQFKTGFAGCSFSEPFFSKIHSQTALFSGITAFAGTGRLYASGSGPTTIIKGQYVSGDYFETLGVRAAVGRMLIPADDTPTASPAVVLNYGYWQRAFGGEFSVVGKAISFNGVPFIIVGVAENRFVSLSPGRVYDVWIPLSIGPRLEQRWDNRHNSAGNWWLTIVGRLRPRTPSAQAQAAVNLAFRNEVLHGEKPALTPADDPAMTLVPAAKALAGSRVLFSDPLYILMFAVGIVLLIACANVGGLMLARATTRQKEMAVRLAVGADRRRIVRQLLTENLLLAVLGGGGLGILFASLGASVLVAFLSTSQPQPLGFTAHLDARILAFTVVVSILTGLLFGIAPAFRSTRVDLTPALKGWAGGPVRAPHVPHRRFSLGSGLVVVQVALAMVVLAGAGLLVHTLANLKSINPGFDSRNVLLFGIDPTVGGYKGARVDNLYRALQDQLSELPGVVSASYSGIALLSGGRESTTREYYPPGSSVKSKLDTDYLSVGPKFFETMRMPLLIGRGFSAADFALAVRANSSSAPGLTAIPVIVNQAFVRRYFSGVNPLGQHFGQSEGKPGERKNPAFEIIGVIRDVKYDDLKREISPTTYAPLSGFSVYFELRTLRNPQSLIPEVRNIVSRLDKNLPIFDIKTQSEQIDQILFRERLIARLFSFFGSLALVLACVGLYGLLSYEVARRSREIGIRMALGGRRVDVLWLVLGEGLRLTLAGAIIGIAGALGLTRLLASFLFGVKPTDILTFSAVTALLCAIALIACYIPARRATRVDPMAALRYE